MSDRAKDVATVLKQEGFELVRRKKHLVYRNSEGRTFTSAATPSDRRASQNQLRDIRRLMNPVRSTNSVDAELPKQQKTRGGAKQPANIYDFYSGMAPRSVPATPEATIKSLQGHLRSGENYKFKSELVKEVCRIIAEGQAWNRAANECLLRDLSEVSSTMLDFMLAAMSETDPTLDPLQNGQGERLFAEASDERRAEYVLFFKVAETVLGRGEAFADDETVEWRIVWVLQRRLDLALKTDGAFRTAITELAGRAANRLLRNESSAKIRASIEPKVAELCRAYRREAGFDFCDLIERIAAEKIGGGVAA